MARQISELSNEDFSLLEMSPHLPTITLPDQTIEAQLAAVLERLRQEVYFSDSGTVSDLDGPCAWSQHDNLNSDLESEPDPPPQSGAHSEHHAAPKQHDGSCHSLAVGKVRQQIGETCQSPVARQQASSESGPNRKPDVNKKPDRLTVRQPANQQRVTDLELQTKLFHLQKTPFNSTLAINHQNESQKGKQRKRRGRRKPCWQPAAHVQRTTTHCSSHPLHPDPEDRLSVSFNHKEVVHFLWQGQATRHGARLSVFTVFLLCTVGWLQVQEELGPVGC